MRTIHPETIEQIESLFLDRKGDIMAIQSAMTERERREWHRFVCSCMADPDGRKRIFEKFGFYRMAAQWRNFEFVTPLPELEILLEELYRHEGMDPEPFILPWQLPEFGSMSAGQKRFARLVFSQIIIQLHAFYEQIWQDVPTEFEHGIIDLLLPHEQIMEALEIEPYRYLELFRLMEPLFRSCAFASNTPCPLRFQGLSLDTDGYLVVEFNAVRFGRQQYFLA